MTAVEEDVTALLASTSRPLRRVEYEALIDAGHLEGSRVELLYGRMVQMPAMKAPHARATTHLDYRLKDGLGRRAMVRVQLPLIAADESEPEPDLAVVPWAEYDDEHPRTALLVIEVADTTLALDLRVKAPLYAASGFEEYWVVDLRGRRVVVHRAAAGGRYQQVSEHRPADAPELRPAAFQDVAIDVAALLG